MMKHNQVVFEEQENQCYQEKCSRVPQTGSLQLKLLPLELKLLPESPWEEEELAMEVEDSHHQGKESEAVLEIEAMKCSKEEMTRAAVEDAPDVGLENRFLILSHRDPHILLKYQTFRYLSRTWWLSRFKSLWCRPSNI